MKTDDFHSLYQLHGGYSLPVLIELRSPISESWYFTNNLHDVFWEDKNYKATTMKYTPPGMRDGIFSGGSWEITVHENDENDQELLKWADTADDQVELIAQAIINEQGVISRLGQLTHQHGSLNWDGERLVWQLGEDDRFNMQINSWTADPDFLID